VREELPSPTKRLDALTDDLIQLPEASRPRIVLISIDPDYDSPDQLRQWAASFRNSSEWTLLTGNPDDLNSIAKALTGSIPSRGEHSPNLVFVDMARGVRRSIYGFASTPEMLAQLTLEDRPTTAPLAAKLREPKEPKEPNEPSPNDPQLVGAWTRIPDWSVVAVHTVLLPTGRVLFWPRFNASGDLIPTTGNDGAKTPQAWVWDPNIPIGKPGRFVNVPNPNTNLFCSGHALLDDGRVMVIGGHDRIADGNADLGVVDVNLFDPAAQSWSRAPDMNVERWYPTLTALPLGSMMAIGGAFSGADKDGTPNQPVEVYEVGGWSGFQQLVGSTTNLAEHVVAVPTFGGRLNDVIILGHQNLMWHSRERLDGSFPDFAQGPVGVPANRAIRVAAIPLPNQGLDVYMVGTDNRMWHSVMRQDGTFPDFAAAPVGSPFNKAIDLAVVRRSSGRITAFMVGTDNHLWRSDQAPDGSFPDFAAQPVANEANRATRLVATLRDNDSVELFMIGMDGSMWHSHEQPNGKFPDFALGPVGSASNKAKTIAVARGPSGRILVYMVGIDGHLWRSQEQANGTYPDFWLHPLGETELVARDISLAPSPDGSEGSVYIINNADENIWRNRQTTALAGWNELELQRTTSVDNGWYIYYPWSFLVPNGSVFVAGAAPSTFWIDLYPSQNLRAGPPRTTFRDYGSAAMYEPGKILVVGGGTTSANQSESSAEIIDLNVASPAWTAVASMHYPRKQATATLLPDGQVLVTSGTRSGGPPSAVYENPGNPVLPAEIWNPNSKNWSVVSAMSEARTYHSTALLLPDGRVLVAGGGQGGDPPIPSHTTADLYSPPYLFRGPRPSVTTVPTTLHYGGSFTVTSKDAASIRRVSLVRLGAVTHAFDENQRFNWLQFSHASGQSLFVSVPANSYICPPGHYMLFLLNSKNVPSVGRIVHVGG
jgi:hypothetical protein